MRFSNDRPIFLQIAELLEDEISSGRLKPGDRLPSARDLAASMEVNPNTAARTLQVLAERQVADMERGSGYFVLPEAKETISRARRERFMSETLPGVFHTMQTLHIGIDQLREYYEDFLQGATDEE